MFRSIWRALLFSAFSLALLASCKPIQPESPASAPPADEVAALPAPEVHAQSEFPIPGLTLTVPEGWTYGFEPSDPVLVVTSPQSGDGAPQSASTHPYLFDDPMIKVALYNTPVVGAEPDLGGLLLKRFGPCAWPRECAVYFKEAPTVVEAPTALEINGMPAVSAVLSGFDWFTDKPFVAHVYAIHSGDQLVYASAPVDGKTPAELLPVVEEMLSTLTVGVPLPTNQQVRQTLAAGKVTPGTLAEGAMTTPAPDEILQQAWTFDAVGGKRYEVRVTGANSAVDPMINILNAEGKSVVGGERDDSGGGETEYLLITPRADGEYSVVVRTFFGQPGPYTIELKQLE